MHKNRQLSLIKYQEVLEQRNKNFFILLSEIKTGKFTLIKPRTRSLFHPKFQKNYLQTRMMKMNARIVKYQSKMFTLTYDTKLYTPLEVVARHKKDFKELTRRIRRIQPDFQYAYFIELTKKFYLHFHVYTDTYINQQWLSDTWKAITGSYIVEIHSIRTDKQKYYAVGYMNVAQKFDMEQLEFIFHNVSRLFGASRGFFEKEKKANNGLPFYERVKFIIINHLDLREYLDCGILKKSYQWKEAEIDFLFANALANREIRILEKVLIFED